MILRSVIAAFLLVSAPGAASYNKLMNQALKAETEKKSADALELYLKAMQLDPEASLPRERILVLYRELKANNKPTIQYELQFPEDLRRQIAPKAAPMTEAATAAEDLRTMNFVFWSIAILLLVGIVAGLIWMLKRVRAQDEEKAFSTRKSPKRAAPIQTSVVKKDVKVTQKTKEEMTGIISSVKSLTNSELNMPIKDPKKEAEEMQGLQDSEVLQALAETMISEVSTEESDKGKFSKLSLEASLLFDESDIPPDLQEWRKKNGDKGIEKYLERMGQKGIKS